MLGIALYPDKTNLKDDQDYLLKAKKIWVSKSFYEYVTNR